MDYVLKDNLTRLGPAVRRAVEGADLRRRQRQDAEQARRTQFAIDHSSQTIAYVAQNGTIVYANAAAEELGGAPLETIVGSRIWDWTPNAGEERWAALWNEALEHPPVEVETDVRTADGSTRAVSVTVDHSGGVDDGAFVVVYARDITERKLAQESLRESETRLEVTLESTGIATWDWDVARDVWSASPQYYTMLGYEPQSGPADRAVWLSRVHPDDRAAVAAKIARVLEGGDAQYDYEARMLHADGSYRWHRVLGRTVERDADGNSVRIVGVRMDITQRRQADEALRQSEAQLRTLVDTLPDLVWLKDPDGVYLSCNRRLEDFMGAREEDIVGKTDYDFTDRELADFFRTHDRAAMAAGGPTANEEEIVFASDGHHETLETIKTPVRASDGRVVGVLGVGRDISERKRSEEALRESEERFRRVSEATSDFAYSCARPRGGSFAFDWLTGAVERITGWSREDLLEWGCWKRLVIADDVPVFEAQVTGLAPGESSVCELRIIDRDGDERWLAAYSEVVLDEDDPGVHRLHGACQDITERKRAEQERARSHELLANLARQVPGVVYQYRLYPDGSSAFPYSSPGMNDIYEVTPEEVREDATPVFGRLHPDDHDRVSADIMDSARTLETFYCEFRVVLPRQGLRWRWSQAHPERTEDGGTLWHGIISDITERKLAEEEIHRQAEQLRRTVEGAVLAMSHVVETRDPYTAGPRAPGRGAGGGDRRRDGPGRRGARGAAPRRHSSTTSARSRCPPRSSPSRGASATSSSGSSASTRRRASTSSRRSTSAARWPRWCCSTTSAWTAPATRAGSPATRSCPRRASSPWPTSSRRCPRTVPTARRSASTRRSRRSARSGHAVRRRRRRRLREAVQGEGVRTYPLNSSRPGGMPARLANIRSFW